jgi:hypothetical protein
MGSITRSLSNNITTGGVILPAGITNDSVSAVTSFANASGGTLILLSTQTASSSATISFTTGLDSTYDEYQFHFINIHPSAQSVFEFNLSTDSGSNYNVTKTSSFFASFHNEADDTTSLSYRSSYDLAQSTAFQTLMEDSIDPTTNNDASGSGTLTLFNPSSTTYVKHFISLCHNMRSGDFAFSNYCAGYANTTSAINAIRFKMSLGNIDDGIIKMYGVKKS